MIGWSAEQVSRASFWQFAAGLEGYRLANTLPDDEPPFPSWDEHMANVAASDTLH